MEVVCDEVWDDMRGEGNPCVNGLKGVWDEVRGEGGCECDLGIQSTVKRRF